MPQTYTIWDRTAACILAGVLCGIVIGPAPMWCPGAPSEEYQKKEVSENSPVLVHFEDDHVSWRLVHVDDTIDAHYFSYTISHTCEYGIAELNDFLIKPESRSEAGLYYVDITCRTSEQEGGAQTVAEYSDIKRWGCNGPPDWAAVLTREEGSRKSFIVTSGCTEESRPFYF